MVPIDEYKGVIRVTLAYVGLHVAFQMLQSYSKWTLLIEQKKKAKKNGDKPLSFKNGDKPLSFKEAHYGEEGRMHPLRLMADRSAGNILEWSWVFMCPLWLHAVFISEADAAWWGWTYVAMRAFYPLGFAMKCPWGVTVCNYTSIAMLMMPLVKAVFLK